LLGLASSGAHSNGYSLIRRILHKREIDPQQMLDGGTIATQLLAPTRIYVKPMLSLFAVVQVKGIAHITGGGLSDNVPRFLRPGLTAVINTRAWPMPALFRWLQEQGDIAPTELRRVFNCGIGMVLALAADELQTAAASLRDAGVECWPIGEIRASDAPAPKVEYI
jgi:phosphoribosylformylglycinamidine cyclo-ligase